MTIAKKLAEIIYEMNNLAGHNNSPVAAAFKHLSDKSGSQDGGITYFNKAYNYLIEIEEKLNNSDKLAENQRDAYIAQLKHVKSLFDVSKYTLSWEQFKQIADFPRVISSVHMFDYFLTTVKEFSISNEEIDDIRSDLRAISNLIDASNLSSKTKRILKNDIDKLFESIELINSIGESEFIKRYKSLSADFLSISDIILKDENEEAIGLIRKFLFRARGWLGLSADVMQVIGVSGPFPALITQAKNIL